MKGMQDTSAKWALAALLCDVWRATERWNFVYQDNQLQLIMYLYYVALGGWPHETQGGCLSLVISTDSCSPQELRRE